MLGIAQLRHNIYDIRLSFRFTQCCLAPNFTGDKLVTITATLLRIEYTVCSLLTAANLVCWWCGGGGGGCVASADLRGPMLQASVLLCCLALMARRVQRTVCCRVPFSLEPV